jgi:AraC-like DNA-binding protein/mannose-6-phosphate isomerase-like protein (cupin superfamily)
MTEEENARSQGPIEYELISHAEGLDVHLFLVTIHSRRTHYHAENELFILLEGSISIHMADRAYLVRKNDFFFVSAYEAHRLSKTDESNTLLVLQFTSQFSRAYYPSLSRMRLRQPLLTRQQDPGLYAQLLQGMLVMFESMGKRGKGYPLAVAAALNHMAYALVQHSSSEFITVSSLSWEERRRTRMMNVVAYVQEHYAGHPSLAELAQKEGVEVSYLSHFIKDTFGISFREYVNRLRLEHALRLINGSDLRLVDICVEAGFSDYRYFTKAFQEAFSKTPQQMRDNRDALRPLYVADNEIAQRQHDVSHIESAYGYILHKLVELQADLPNNTK